MEGSNIEPLKASSYLGVRLNLYDYVSCVYIRLIAILLGFEEVQLCFCVQQSKPSELRQSDLVRYFPIPERFLNYIFCLNQATFLPNPSQIQSLVITRYIIAGKMEVFR